MNVLICVKASWNMWSTYPDQIFHDPENGIISPVHFLSFYTPIIIPPPYFFPFHALFIIRPLHLSYLLPTNSLTNVGGSNYSFIFFCISFYSIYLPKCIIAEFLLFFFPWLPCQFYRSSWNKQTNNACETKSTIFKISANINIFSSYNCLFFFQLHLHIKWKY